MLFKSLKPAVLIRIDDIAENMNWEIMNKCEIIAGIPMPGGEKSNKSGGVRSLNLSVACGIVCYSACLKLNLLYK